MHLPAILSARGEKNVEESINVNNGSFLNAIRVSSEIKS